LKQINISTKRLFLHRLQLEDASGLISYRSNPEVFKYQNWKPKTIDDGIIFINALADSPGIADSWYQMGIFLKENSDLIGDIGIHFLPPEAKQVELGYSLTPEQQRKGYAAEALSSVIDYLFYQMNIQRAICFIDSRNIRSQMLVKRLGLKPVVHAEPGTLPGEIVFSLTPDEWSSKQTN
jgi:RimJ/RimL family protein N-acetyltransferase